MLIQYTVAEHDTKKFLVSCSATVYCISINS